MIEMRYKWKIVLGKIKKLLQRRKKFITIPAKSNAISLGKKSRLGHLILWVALVFFIIALVWAKYATLDEITHAEGKVIPSRKVQIVQNLEGGIVKDILVREGQTVLQNQILMYIDDTRFSSAYKEKQLEALALKVKIARLSAQVNDKPLAIAKNLQQKVPALASTQRSLYSSRKNELNLLQTRRKLLLQEVNMTKPLVGEGVASKVELLHLERKLGEIEGKISSFRSSALNELQTAMAQLSQIQETHLALKDRVERTAVRSPVRGIIKQIYVATIGGVVKPGMDLMEIVPLEDTLLIEAQVRPSNIGFLHPGQNAMVKITAYDFSIYGGLAAKVEHISADTTKDEKGKSYYEIWVRTKRASLGSKTNPLAIIPGMQASVDIMTGRKTVLNYILKPILKAKQRAMRER